MKHMIVVLLTTAALALTSSALAQNADVSAALAAGKIGEQADGYLGIRSPVPAAVKAEVEAINIKRRDFYTTRADQLKVLPREYAATIGCETLEKRVAPGRAYLLRDGVWRVREGTAPIELPDYCGSK
jgi:uncharacterized protein